MNNEFLDDEEVGFDLPTYFPVLQTFASAPERRRTLGALHELSFVAGRAGDPRSDWEGDTDAAIDQAFGAVRPDRRALVKLLLRRAYDDGMIYHWVDQAQVPAAAKALARAYAVAFEADVAIEESGCSPGVLQCQAEQMAYKVAVRRPVDAYQAARAVIDAMAAVGLKTRAPLAFRIVEQALRGERERGRLNRRRNGEQSDFHAILDSIFDEEAGE